MKSNNSFYHQMKALVDRHGATKNPYLDRFARGEITRQEFQRFALEFYQFARFFPRILVTQLVNAEDERVADELTRLLYSELGGGDPRKRHELLYRKFLRSIGLSVTEAMRQPMLPSTRAYIRGMERLYESPNRFLALGASFGLENMAISMWDHLLPGLRAIKKRRWYPRMDIAYFTFHRALEHTHEDAMERALAAKAGMGPKERRDFCRGAVKVLDYLEGFWMGLEAQRPAHARRTVA